LPVADHLTFVIHTGSTPASKTMMQRATNHRRQFLGVPEVMSANHGIARKSPVTVSRYHFGRYAQPQASISEDLAIEGERFELRHAKMKGICYVASAHPGEDLNGSGGGHKCSAEGEAIAGFEIAFGDVLVTDARGG
jgi:hypothetical protein